MSNTQNITLPHHMKLAGDKDKQLKDARVREDWAYQFENGRLKMPRGWASHPEGTFPFYRTLDRHPRWFNPRNPDCVPGVNYVGLDSGLECIFPGDQFEQLQEAMQNGLCVTLFGHGVEEFVSSMRKGQQRPMNGKPLHLLLMTNSHHPIPLSCKVSHVNSPTDYETSKWIRAGGKFHKVNNGLARHFWHDDRYAAQLPGNWDNYSQCTQVTTVAAENERIHEASRENREQFAHNSANNFRGNLIKKDTHPSLLVEWVRPFPGVNGHTEEDLSEWRPQCDESHDFGFPEGRVPFYRDEVDGVELDPLYDQKEIDDYLRSTGALPPAKISPHSEIQPKDDHLGASIPAKSIPETEQKDDYVSYGGWSRSEPKRKLQDEVRIHAQDTPLHMYTYIHERYNASDMEGFLPGENEDRYISYYNLHEQEPRVRKAKIMSKSQISASKVGFDGHKLSLCDALGQESWQHCAIIHLAYKVSRKRMNEWDVEWPGPGRSTEAPFDAIHYYAALQIRACKEHTSILDNDICKTDEDGRVVGPPLPYDGKPTPPGMKEDVANYGDLQKWVGRDTLTGPMKMEFNPEPDDGDFQQGKGKGKGKDDGEGKDNGKDKGKKTKTKTRKAFANLFADMADM